MKFKDVPIASYQIFLNKFRSDDTQEGSRGLVSDGLSQQSFTSARCSVEDDTLWRLDAHFLVVLGMCKGKFDRLLNLLDLRVETTNIGICLLWCLLQLHDGDHRVSVVAEHTDDCMDFVIEKNRTARLQLVLVDERQNADVVLATDGGRDNCVIVIDDLLQITHRHWGSTQVVNLRAFFLVLLFLWLQALLVANELFFHQQEILDPFQLQQLETASSVRSDLRKLQRCVWSLLLALLLADASRDWGLVLLLFILVILLVASSSARLILTLNKRKSS